MKNRLLGLIVALFALTSCQKGGFAPSVALVDSAYQLAYGASVSDREQLANRIAGNAPPKFAEVISKWKRFSGSTYYPTVPTIIATPSYCQTTLDGNGSWANSLSPVANPNTDGACNTQSMNSLSWIYLTGPDRLFNIQNTNNYNGFFSSLKFDTYISSTVLSSTDADNDGIGVIIAAAVDSSTGFVHTLSAYRTGNGIQPNLGWGLLHKVNGAVVRIIGNKTVAGAAGAGWSGRYTSVTIERVGHIVKATASPWSTVSTGLIPEAASLIQLDLSDPAEGLQIFMGPQSYGYESYSQARATFSNLSFITPLANTDPDYLFDLKNNLVYSKKVTGIGYELVTGLKAYDVLGFPRTITNLETQGQFTINSSTAYGEL
jgi:hypothetical protein